jgi:hypothetical protein
MPDEITPRGRVYLGTIQFTSDPSEYKPLDWPRRISKFTVIGAGAIRQDWGLYAGDIDIHLASGDASPISKDVTIMIHTLYRARTPLVFLDWADNSFHVNIDDFKCWPNIVGPLYKYEMTLGVNSIIKLMGNTYGGS